MTANVWGRLLLGAGLLSACGENAGGGGGTEIADGALPAADGGPGDGAPADTGVPEGPCGNTPESLRGCVQTERYATELQGLATTPREVDTAQWQAAQDRCASELERLGFRVERHDYGTGINVIGVLPGVEKPDEHVIVAAHYDSVIGCGGADDNASGVAGALEAARVLSTQRYARTLVVACWDEEEQGLIGSTAYARRAKARETKIVANYTLEMIGYASDEPHSQRLPAGLDLVFPTQARQIADNEFRGDFITVVGDDINPAAPAAMEAHGTAVGLPVVRLELVEGFRGAPEFGDLRRSDHAPFWDLGYPGIMVTDTSEFRNPNYHCAWAPDAVDDIDIAFASKVVQAVVGSAAEQLEVRPGAPAPTSDAGVPSDAGTPPAPVPACDAVTGACDGGRKCALVLDDEGIRCVDAAGDVAAGQSCTRTGAPGIDDCGPGLFCALFGLPLSTPQQRQCLPVCRTTAECGEGAFCAALTDAAGVCVPRCDPFGDACAAGTRCALYQETGNTYDYSCAFAGAVSEGGDCSRDACAPGLECDRIAHTLTPTCRAYCDAAHPCPDGKTCVRRTDYGRPTVGLCATPGE